MPRETAGERFKREASERAEKYGRTQHPWLQGGSREAERPGTPSGPIVVPPGTKPRTTKREFGPGDV